MDNDSVERKSNRFIFTDEFYNSLEDINSQENSAKEEKTNPISIPEIPKVIPSEPIKEEISEPQKFFDNRTVETTTVYDDIGNTISKTITDSSKPDEVIEEIKPTIIEEPIEEEKEVLDDGKPDLGIPTVNDMPEIREVELPSIEEQVPNIVEKNQSDINLNVETGIDTSLEQQLINNKDIYVPEPTNEFYGYGFEKPPVEKYRAVRRQINPIAYQDDNEIDQKEIEEAKEIMDEVQEANWKPEEQPAPIEITEEVNYEEPIKEEVVTKSDLLPKLIKKEKETGKISILARYGDDFTSHDYVTNPAIGRDREIKELGLILLTPEKSAILVGKPGIGKTSIVEGFAYQLQRGNVPDALKGYTIISVKTTSLLGSLTNGETRLQTLIDELKGLDKIILFIDEVHMLMGATNESSLDFANMFKESLGRGSIKMIGATTSEEYERYVLRDKAFVRRFQRVDVNEPTREETIEILMGTLPKIEKATGAKLKYTHFIKTEIMSFITDITTEYKRVYGIGSRYPDICITLVNQAFSEAVFNNRTEVNIFDIRSAIEHSKNIYPDVIRKELVNFDVKFKNIIDEEKNNQ